MEKETKKKYVIGVDGGGTKTIAALANSEGKIFKLARTGPSSFIKVGIEETVLNITKAIKILLKNKKKIKVFSTFIGLAAVEENKEIKKVIKKKLLKKPELSGIFKGKVVIGSDQILGFRSGTNEKDGVVLISGTGSAAHGWKGKREAHTSGWGWLNDEGSAFWIGQKAYQVILKDLDGRGPKTLITKLVLKKLRVRTPSGIKREIYIKKNNLIKKIASFSLLVNKTAQKGDKIAKNLLIEAGRELALSTQTVIKKLNLQRKKFPLVLIGSMFKSKIVLETVKKEIKKIAPKVKFIRPKDEPVIGAIKLAIENL